MEEEKELDFSVSNNSNTLNFAVTNINEFKSTIEIAIRQVDELRITLRKLNFFDIKFKINLE